MNNHYGYVKRSLGADGDQVDVFLGNNPSANHVYVINQNDPKTGKFDEHKVMLGFDSFESANKPTIPIIQKDGKATAQWSGIHCAILRTS